MTPERMTKLRAVLDKRQPDLTVLTDYVHKGRNLSAIVRTCDAVGIGDVHCVIGDKDYRSFRGTALGSHQWVQVHRYTQLVKPVQRLKQRGFQIVAAHFSEQAVDFHQVDYTMPTAVMLGAERDGLSAEGAELADIHITIPMVGMVGSFNVSVAAGIILSEAQRQRQQGAYYQRRRVDAESYQRLLFEWAHPKVRDFCQRHHFDYPALLDDGEIDGASAWYASMKALLASRETSIAQG